MKKIVLTLGVCFVIIVMIFCVRTEKDSLTSRKSHKYYTNYIKKEMIKNGVEKTEYFKIGVDDDKAEASYKNLSHSEIMSALDESILIVKKQFEEATLYQAKEVNLLISTIKEYNLADKEEFYKKLLDVDSDIERINLYYKETNRRSSELRDATTNNDVKLTLKIMEKYSYLNLLVRDEKGIYTPYLSNFTPDKKGELRYSIEKYDGVYKNKEKERKRLESLGLSRSARYVNGLKVE